MQPSAAATVDYDQGWTAWDDMKRFGPMSRHTRRLQASFLRRLRFESALDIGCGQGECLRAVHVLHPAARLTGIDISSTGVELSRAHVPGGRFEVLDVQQEALPEQFDLVLCLDVLEHIPDDVAALRNIRAMTRGRFLCSTLTGTMRPFEREMGHVRNYTRAELEGKLAAAGFRVAEVVEWGWPFYSPLYRNMTNSVPVAATTGRFGIGRKILSSVLYALFLLNSNRHGDYIWILAEPA